MKSRICLIVSALLLSTAGPASGKGESANRLYDEGLGLMKAIEGQLRAGAYKRKRLSRTQAKKFKAVETKFKAALKRAPNHGRAHIMLGMLYKFGGRNHKAISHLKQGMQLPKKSRDWWIAADSLGSVYMEMNNARLGASIFKKIVRVKPKNSMAYYKLGVCLWSLKKNRQAKKALRKVIALRSTHVAQAKNILRKIK